MRTFIRETGSITTRELASDSLLARSIGATRIGGRGFWLRELVGGLVKMSTEVAVSGRLATLGKGGTGGLKAPARLDRL